MKINIVTSINPFPGISDQIEVLLIICKLKGYDYKISRKIDQNAYNILFENFNPKNTNYIIDECERYKIKIAVLMTEHIDYINNNYLFHGASIQVRDEYIGNMARHSRLSHLMRLSPHIHAFLRIGDLPYMRGFENAFPHVTIHEIPFPTLERVSKDTVKYSTDVIFSGFLTNYRKSILSKIGSQVRCDFLKGGLSRKRRNLNYKSAKYVLNIPQSKYWSWVSSMRILSSLIMCRPIINFSSVDLKGLMSSVSENINEMKDLSHFILTQDSYLVYLNQLSSYNKIVYENFSSYNGRLGSNSYYLIHS